jgi:hypothetical protein
MQQHIDKKQKLKQQKPLQHLKHIPLHFRTSGCFAPDPLHPKDKHLDVFTWLDSCSEHSL